MPIHQILDTLVQGHPQRSMLLAHHLWRATPPRHQATLDTWVNAFDAAVAATSDEITVLWDHLKTYHRRVITVIAQNQYRLKAHQTGLSQGAATNDALRALLGSGEIIEDPGAVSGYRVTDPLFAYWARTGRH